MKLRPKTSIQPRIFDGGYQHPWYERSQTYVDDNLNRPNPPSKEAVEKAKFVDKTYQWVRNNSVRPGGKRTSK